MYEQSSQYSYSSHELEKVALNRFRIFVDFVPSDCRIFRETWDRSTVICLDFQACPHWLEVIKEKSDVLLNAVKYLGLGKSIIFKIGNQVRGWRTLKPSDSEL